MATEAKLAVNAAAGVYGTCETGRKETDDDGSQRRKRYVLVLTAHTVTLLFGLRYTAPVWLPDIKDRLSFSQEQMSSIGWFLYAGSIVLGIPLNRVAERWCGKQGAFWIVACCAPFGYIYLHFAMVYKITYISLLYVASLLIGYSTGAAAGILLEMMNERLGNDYLPILSGTMNLSYSLGGVTGCIGYMNGHNAEKFLLALAIIHFLALLPVGVIQYLRNKVPVKTNGDQGAPLLEGQENQASVVEAYKIIFRKPSYYVVIMIAFLLVGVMTSIATNLGSLAKTLHANAKQTNNLVLIMMGSQGVGRLVTLGINSLVKYLKPNLPSQKVANPSIAVSIWISFVASTVTSLGVAKVWGDVHQFAGFCVIYGFAYGMMWVIVYQIAQLVDSKENWLNILLMTILPFAGLGGLVFHLIVGQLYDSYSGTKHNDNGAIVCFGVGCFQQGFVLWMVGALALLFLLIVYLVYHIKRTGDMWTAPT